MHDVSGRHRMIEAGTRGSETLMAFRGGTPWLCSGVAAPEFEARVPKLGT